MEYLAYKFPSKSLFAIRLFRQMLSCPVFPYNRFSRNRSRSRAADRKQNIIWHKWAETQSEAPSFFIIIINYEAKVKDPSYTCWIYLQTSMTGWIYRTSRQIIELCIKLRTIVLKSLSECSFTCCQMTYICMSLAAPTFI